MKARKVKATFEIREDDNNAGVAFYISGRIHEWKDLTAKEQRKMLNAWAGMYNLFYRFLKEEEI
jgi:hypothetical protein